MKKILISLTSLLLSAQSLWAVDFLYQDNRGHRIFECESPGYVGKATVIQRRGGVYEVFGPGYKGRISAEDHEEAAQVACRELGPDGGELQIEGKEKKEKKEKRR